MPPRARLASAVLLGLGVAGKVRWDKAAHADPTATRRKVAVATWSAPREGRLMTRLVVDADPVLAYVTAQRAQGAQGLTPMHVLGAAAARALLVVPDANARTVGGHIVPFDDVAIGFAVDIGRGTDLAPCKVTGAATLTPAQIATQVREAVVRLRDGTDVDFALSSRVAAAVPTLLMRPMLMATSVLLGGLGTGLLGQQGNPLGAVFISNVGALGVEEVFLAPVPFARAHVYISLGTITERAVVRDGVVVPVRQFTLCLTGDHRLVDGIQCAIFFEALLALLTDPARMHDH